MRDNLAEKAKRLFIERTNDCYGQPHWLLRPWVVFIFGVALLALVGAATAETRTYLVKRAEHFPQDRFVENWSPLEYRLFVNTGKKTIEEAGGQPFRITSYEINYDGKYALLSVTAKDEDEKWHYASMESKGYIVLVSSGDVLNVYNPRIGGYELVPDFKHLSDLPTDYYQVEGSTGT